jgi:hypothetical protein
MENINKNDNDSKNLEIVKVTWLHDGPDVTVEWWVTSKGIAWDTLKTIENDIDGVLGEKSKPVRLYKAGGIPPDGIRLEWDLYKNEWWTADNLTCSRLMLAFQRESKSWHTTTPQ